MLSIKYTFSILEGKNKYLLVLYVQIVDFVLAVLWKLLKIQRSGPGSKQTFCMSELGPSAIRQTALT